MTTVAAKILAEDIKLSQLSNEKGYVMLRKVSMILFLLISATIVSGCSVNLYNPNIKGMVRPSRIEGKCVVIVEGYTIDSAGNQQLCIVPHFGEDKFRLIGNVVQSRNKLTGDEYQIYQIRRDGNKIERWQIFTMPLKPGRYRFGMSINAGIDKYLRKGLGIFWPITSSVFEAKAGEFIYLGRMKVETIKKRGGADEEDVAVTWDSLIENLDFVREKIPKLKDVEIIHVPITIESKGYSLFVQKKE
jgi:hypothetical protein